LTPADRRALEKAGKLRPGEKLCTAKSVIRDTATRQPILDANGKRQYKPCRKRALVGGHVCEKHGGTAPQVKARAARRLLAVVEPTLDRLMKLRDQDDHLPTAMMATKEILNRAGGAALGPVDPQGGKVDTRPVINIGIQVGGIDQSKLTAPDVSVGMLPAADLVTSDE
jgi:hypothetical protein